MTAMPKRRAALMSRLKELDARLHVIEEALEEPASKDWEEAAVEREGDEVLEQLGQTSEAEVARIRAALARMRAGTYGICVRCEEPISDARLDVLPETALCRTCAAEG